VVTKIPSACFSVSLTSWTAEARSPAVDDELHVGEITLHRIKRCLISGSPLACQLDVASGRRGSRRSRATLTLLCAAGADELRLVGPKWTTGLAAKPGRAATKLQEFSSLDLVRMISMSY
jgi:hypothetical protein